MPTPPFKNGGKEWRPEGNPAKVNVHDFPDKELGKAIPYAAAGGFCDSAGVGGRRPVRDGPFYYEDDDDGDDDYELVFEDTIYLSGTFTCTTANGTR